MNELAEKIQKILTQFLQEEIGNRVSQFSMKGLRDIIFTEIINYKPGENKKEVNTCRPVVKEAVKEDKK